MKKLESLNVEGKVVLLRVDFNVPLSAELQVLDDTRIRKAVPTIKYLTEHGAKVVLMSHLGRPQKKRLPDGSIDQTRFSLRPTVKTLSELVSREVQFCDKTIGEKAKQQIEQMQNGNILILENTRFHTEEEKGNEDFAKSIASLGQLYVNDAFGTAHRAHASTAIMARYFSSDQKAFGFLMQDEIENGNKVLNHPLHPFVAILGGAKVSDKIDLIEKLLETADTLIIGGGMAFTFVKAMQGEVGNSLVEEDKLDLALDLLDRAKASGKKILLPIDSKIANGFADDADSKITFTSEIPEGWMGLDIGPEASKQFSEEIQKAKMILWNGPMGVFEFSSFATGTKDIAKAVAEATDQGAFSMVGGGDSVSAINQSGLSDRISFISTGGGAMLEFLEGKILPGIEAILE